MRKKIYDLIARKEMDFFELDNIMMSEGFYSNFDDGCIPDCLYDKSIIYRLKTEDDTDYNIIVRFEIVIYADPKEEAVEASVIKITEVEEY